jgi:hypothetical protein
MQKFELNPSDVVRGGSGRSGGRKKTRFSRANQVSSHEMILAHRPTGVRVQGEIKAGNYTRDEMRKLQNKLYQELYVLLESEVAKTLRISGR